MSLPLAAPLRGELISHRDPDQADATAPNAVHLLEPDAGDLAPVPAQHRQSGGIQRGRCAPAAAYPPSPGGTRWCGGNRSARQEPPRAERSSAGVLGRLLQALDLLGRASTWVLRYPVSPRSSRISGEGRNEDRTIPWAAKPAGHPHPQGASTTEVTVADRTVPLHPRACHRRSHRGVGLPGRGPEPPWRSDGPFRHRRRRG